MNAKKIASPVLFSVPHRDFVVALDFGGTKIDVATADLDGFLLQQQRIETDAPQGAEQAVERAFAVARTLIVRTVEMTGGCCLAVGVVSPGVILPDRVMLAPNIPGWEHLALRELVRGGLGIAHIAVGNDVKAAAMAEVHWGSLQGADPAIFLSLGTGIAAALIVGGQVITGAHGASGEIGYNLRGVAHETSVSRGHAPLEEVVGGRAIGEEGSRILGGNLSAAEVFTHPDIRARSLIEERLAELALHVANLAIFIDPMRIAVGGGLMSSGDVIINTLTSCLRSAVPFPPEVMPARFVHEAALLGAVALALESLEIAPLRETVLDEKGEIVIETNTRKKDPGSVSTS